MPDPWPPSFHHTVLAPFRAVGHLVRRPRLWLLAAAPVFINFLLFIILVTMSYRLAVVPLSDRFLEIGPGLGPALVIVARVILTLFFLVISGVVALLLLIPVSAPFCDAISENIEAEMLAHRPELLAPPQTIPQSIRHSFFDAVRRVLIVIPILVGILVVGWVPLIGPPTALLLGFANNVMFLSLDGFSYSLDRRGVSFLQKWRYLNQRQPLRVPLGVSLALLVLIPCNIFFLPMVSAVAGTRLFCEDLLRHPGGAENFPSTRKPEQGKS